MTLTLARPTWLPLDATAWPHATKDWTVYHRGHWYRARPETGRLLRAGTDSKLPGLQQALACGEHLISWRVGRRAIVRRNDGSWRKLTRPNKIDELETSWRTATQSSVTTPAVRSVDSNSLVIEHLDGTPLNQLNLTEAAPEVLSRIAGTIVAWHATPTRNLAEWTPDTEDTWINTVARASPAVADQLRRLADPLPALHRSPTLRGLVHGDLHDKNIINSDNTLALIDLDDVRSGPIEADIANLAAHLTLRSLQRAEPLALGLKCAEQLLEQVDKYTSVDRTYADRLVSHTFFRLSALYTFRPGAHQIVPNLIEATRHH